MRTRLQQTVAVGEEVLEAALEEFLAHGFHGATLDRIAGRAGYTKGAVYSRYASKADLFLTLLERRIEQRRLENRRLAEGLRGTPGVVSLAEHWAVRQQHDQAWTLLVIEFRVHAARNPELLERYAALHDRSIRGIADALEAVVGADADRRRRLAQAVFAMGTGIALEQVVDPSAARPALVEQLVTALLGAEVVT